MAYKATLTFASKTYSILSANWSFSRSVDQKGRPSSGVYGGEVSLSVESTDDAELLKNMLNTQTKAQEAKIVFDKGTADGALKEMTLTDAYIIAISEGISFGGSDPGTISFTLTARKFALKDAVHENDWPGGKANS